MNLASFLAALALGFVAAEGPIPGHSVETLVALRNSPQGPVMAVVPSP